MSPAISYVPLEQMDERIVSGSNDCSLDRRPAGRKHLDAAIRLGVTGE